MRLEKIDATTFRSTAKAYGPTGGENGAYGGHVFAQSVWAAAQTVKEGFVVHVCCPFLRFSFDDLVQFGWDNGVVGENARCRQMKNGTELSREI